MDRPRSAQELTIGKLAERAGVTTSTLRHYEAMGLIHSRRTPGNQRRYPRSALRRVALIRVAQGVGVSLREIGRALAAVPDDHAPTRAEWAGLSRRWSGELTARIEQLTRLRDLLDDCTGCGCLSLDRCAVANPTDHLGELGSGPHRLLVDRSPLVGEPGV
ncbi:redox-sensitive transcriptional activator SoxR (plasmid) [Streptomyces sp. BI20]|uniref:redox-sensitive transcriptional activator SoxR n=1 Tax=Streptomyces sp. BI20 TaxID=3403460 RepID=UPI003C78709F